MGNKFIPLSVPNLKGKELEYVTNAISTEWVSSGGPYVIEFENKLAQYVHAKGAVSCQSGTAGLHIALEACGVCKDEEVIVPALTFIAAVNPVRYIGAEPIFMDCDHSLTIDPAKLESFCENECVFKDGSLYNKKTKKKIRAIVIVHVFGNMANMERIIPLCNKFNLKLIEDATEAIGTYYTEGLYKGQYAGTIGDVGVYSFNGNKIITTGGGGMIVSNDRSLLEEAKHLTTQAKSDELYYTHDRVGYNYRMTNLQAALGVAQLEQIEDFIRIKAKNYQDYQEKILELEGLELLDFRRDIRPNYWFYALYISEEYVVNRDMLIRYLSTKNVQSRPIWGLINEQKPYLGSQSYKIEIAKSYWEHVVNIPCGSNLTKEDVGYVVECLKSVDKEF